MRAAERLTAAKVARDGAHDAFFARLDQVKGDVSTRGVGDRIADRLGEGAKDTFAEAFEIVDENRVVVGGTIAALLVWFLRRPIISWVSNAFTGNDNDDEDEKGESRHDHAEAS